VLLLVSYTITSLGKQLGLQACEVHDSGKGVSPPHRWHSFQLEAESTQGPKCSQKD